MKPGPILVVPCSEKGRGGGHLVRSLILVRDLRSLGREAWLYLAPAHSPRDFFRLCEGFSGSWLVSDPRSPAGSGAAQDPVSPGGDPVSAAGPWAFIVLDRFKTPENEFRSWAALAPLIGIDEGGRRRPCFDFLLDLLPGLSRRAEPNMAVPSLIPLPQNRRPLLGTGKKTGEGKPLRVLVSFGAEDPAGLGLLVSRALAAENTAGELEINFLGGGLSPPDPASGSGGLHRNGAAEQPGGPGIRILKPLPHLGEHLAEYDLLITHFGLTAFEALYAGLPVLLVSPGPYHEKLAKNAGLYSAGIGEKGVRRAASLLFRPASGSGGPKTLNRAFLETLGPEKTAARHGLDRPQKQTLAGLLGTFSPLISPACPACGNLNRAAAVSAGGHTAGAGAFPPVLARFERRTYRRCPRCGIVYMERLDPPPVEYSRDYFFDFYKKQYGKTYLDDFPALIVMGKERLKRIRALLPGEGRLLDIGCAYGPFLAAAKEAGFSPLGMDPSEDAVTYVRETLNLEAHRGFFPSAGIPALETAHSFDVISLWYVIEHFRDPRRALAEARRLLKPGGVLAFSTPSFSGVSGRKSRRKFLEESPADHWTIWSPQNCGMILRRAGFRLRRLHVTGHHPERFPLIGRFARPGGALYTVLLLASRVFRLGDTFEAYAAAKPEKTAEPSAKVSA